MIRLLIALVLLSASALAVRADEIDAAKRRWAESPHGPMLERILPPTFERKQLPEPRSRGAQLVLRYCIQCHNLPNPAMHDAKRWPSVLDRMVARMRGKGNLGALMTEMMANVEAPDEAGQQALLAYFTRHAQKPLDETRIPEVLRPSGESFRLACSQCHVLPDPKRHTAAQWPAVVERMRQNMEWMNRVVGSKPDPTEPQLRIEEINAFLARYARGATQSRLQSRLGRPVALEGVAEARKLGAALRGSDFEVWIDRLEHWPAEAVGRKVRVTGILGERYDLPVYIQKRGEPPAAGIPVPQGTDLREASRRYIVRDATWSLIP